MSEKLKDSQKNYLRIMWAHHIFKLSDLDTGSSEYNALYDRIGKSVCSAKSLARSVDETEFMKKLDSIESRMYLEHLVRYEDYLKLGAYI